MRKLLLLALLGTAVIAGQHVDNARASTVATALSRVQRNGNDCNTGCQFGVAFPGTAGYNWVNTFGFMAHDQDGQCFPKYPTWITSCGAHPYNAGVGVSYSPGGTMKGKARQACLTPGTYRYSETHSWNTVGTYRWLDFSVLNILTTGGCFP